jgi:hypothetical protein
LLAVLLLYPLMIEPLEAYWIFDEDVFGEIIFYGRSCYCSRMLMLGFDYS